MMPKFIPSPVESTQQAEAKAAPRKGQVVKLSAKAEAYVPLGAINKVFLNLPSCKMQLEHCIYALRFECLNYALNPCYATEHDCARESVPSSQ